MSSSDPYHLVRDDIQASVSEGGRERERRGNLLSLFFWAPMENEKKKTIDPCCVIFSAAPRALLEGAVRSETPLRGQIHDLSILGDSFREN